MVKYDFAAFDLHFLASVKRQEVREWYDQKKTKTKTPTVILLQAEGPTAGYYCRKQLQNNQNTV